MLLCWCIAAIIFCHLDPGTLQGHLKREKYYRSIMVERIADSSLAFPARFAQCEQYEVSKGELWCSILSGSADIRKLALLLPEESAMNIIVCGKDVSKNTVRNNVPVHFLVYSDSSYCEYAVRFTTLPVFFLETERAADDLDQPCLLNGLPGEIHIRGASGRGREKQSFKIRMEKKVSFLDMRKDDDWVLNAVYNDPERIRNVFSSNLWYKSCCGNNGFSVRNGYEYRYVELFLNGSYHGLYALGYKPDRKQFDLKDDEYLFSKINYLNNEYGYKLHGKSLETPGEAWAALQTDYAEDDDSSIDMWLFVLLCNAQDNSEKNYYLALKKNGSGYEAIYSPWDLDLTWGNTWSEDGINEVAEYAVDYESIVSFFPCEAHYRILSGDSETLSRAMGRYRELRQNAWSDKELLRQLDGYEEQIYGSGAYRRDISRWPDSNVQDPENGLSVFRKYVLARTKWLDKNLEKTVLSYCEE